MSKKHDSPLPEFIELVFTKTNPKRSFSLNRKRAFWLVFVKTGSIISGTCVLRTIRFMSDDMLRELKGMLYLVNIKRNVEPNSQSLTGGIYIVYSGLGLSYWLAGTTTL